MYLNDTIRNLLLSNESVLKIADLGVSKITTSTLNTYSIAGTREYMSPEMHKCGGIDDESDNQNGWHSAKADIWFVNFSNFLLKKDIILLSKKSGHLDVFSLSC